MRKAHKRAHPGPDGFHHSPLCSLKKSYARERMRTEHMMYEHRTEPLLTRAQFACRLLRHGAVAALVVGLSLAIGTVGYHFAASLTWLDALLNAVMILTGMGPVAPLQSPAAKLFAIAYALYAGIVFLAVTGTMFAPVLHRLLHWLYRDKGPS